MSEPRRDGSLAGAVGVVATASFLIVGVLGAGCAGPGAAGPDAAAAMTVWSSLDQYVRVEPRDDAGDPSAVPNEHPAEVSRGDLGSFLEAALARRGPSEEATAALAPDQLEVLAREVPEAFRRAGPGQDVTFAVLGVKRVVVGIGKGPTLATGRMFVQGGSLNLIFGDVQKRVDLYSGRPVEPFVPGSRQPRSARDQGFVLETSPEASRAITLVRSDWVRADLAGSPASPPQSPASPPTVAAPEAPVAPEAGSTAPMPGAAPTVPDPAKRSEEQASAERVSAAEAPKRGSAPESAGAPTAPPTKALAEPEAASPPVPGPIPASPKARQELEDLQQRLWVLEELRRKGLVTDEEYRASRARILGEL